MRKGVPGLLEDLGARKVTMGSFGDESGDPRPGPLAKRAGHLTGEIIVDSVLKHLNFRKKREHSENSGRVVAYGLDRFHRVKNPVRNENWSGVGRRERQ